MKVPNSHNRFWPPPPIHSCNLTSHVAHLCSLILRWPCWESCLAKPCPVDGSHFSCYICGAILKQMNKFWSNMDTESDFRFSVCLTHTDRTVFYLFSHKVLSPWFKNNSVGEPISLENKKTGRRNDSVPTWQCCYTSVFKMKSTGSGSELCK